MRKLDYIFMSDSQRSVEEIVIDYFSKLFNLSRYNIRWINAYSLFSYCCRRVYYKFLNMLYVCK